MKYYNGGLRRIEKNKQTNKTKDKKQNKTKQKGCDKNKKKEKTFSFVAAD